MKKRFYFEEIEYAKDTAQKVGFEFAIGYLTALNAVAIYDDELCEEIDGLTEITVAIDTAMKDILDVEA